MQINYNFTPEEIKLHMQLIAETYRLGSRPTETGRGKRLFQQYIPADLQPTALEVVKKCKAFTGKSNVTLTGDELVALRLLVAYVMSL